MDKIEEHKRSFFNSAVADILRAFDGGSFTGSFILTFCLIDYMAWIEYGNVKEGFQKWIEERLGPIRHGYIIKKKELWNIRCGLVHTYGPSKRMIKHGEFNGYRLLGFDGLHLEYLNDSGLNINIYYLLSECFYAAHQTFEDLKSSHSPEQLDRLARQIKQLGIQPSNLKYGDMHKVLRCMDEEVFTIDHLRATMTEAYI